MKNELTVCTPYIQTETTLRDRNIVSARGTGPIISASHLEKHQMTGYFDNVVNPIPVAG